MTKFEIVRVRITASIVLRARVPLQGDDVCDRENLACVRNQLKHYGRTGLFTPPHSSEPGIDEPEFGIRITRERAGATVCRTRKVARRG